MLCANGVAAGADQVNSFTATLGIHLFQDAMDVIPYRVLRQIEARGDFLIGQALGNLESEWA